MNRDEIEALMIELRTVLRSFHHEARIIDESIMLTSSDLMELLEVSKSTLYRWRRDRMIPFEVQSDRTVLYPFQDVFLSIKCGRVRAKGFRKLDAIKKLKAYRDGVIRGRGYFFEEENVNEL